MRWLGLRSLRAAAALSAWVLAATLVFGPSVATASHRDDSSSIPAVDTLQIGPISAGDGFLAYVTEQGCGSSHPFFQVAFIARRSAEILSHTYTGAGASCSIQRTAATATLRASLSGAIDIDAQISGVGLALAHPGLPAGCGAPFGPELPATATGRIDVTIHPAVFGRIQTSQANAQIFTGAPQQCPAVQSTSGRQFTAEVGPYVINAVAPARGQAQLEIFDGFRDTDSSGLTGALTLEIDGRGAYGAHGSAGSAQIGAAGPFTSGSLAFSALSPCPGYTAANGYLSGTLTVDDPLLGALAISGAAASEAFTAQAQAEPGTCNGAGSEPVVPELITNCAKSNDGCSLQAGMGTATLFDETSPGTQTITAETVNFGDGSAPVSITNDGSVQHAYATAGTYTATLTVTDDLGDTATATAPVVIDP